MVFFAKKRASRPEQSGWIINQAGREMTAAAALIAADLEELKKKRTILILTSKGYQSSGTVLVDYGPAGLVIGRPADLPKENAPVRVHFRSPTKVSCFFDVQVLNCSEDLLFTSAPRQLTRLQRRAHYRVETAEGSRATFSSQGEQFHCRAVKDLSIGGMLCCGVENLAENAPLTNISLTLPCCSGDGQAIEVAIPQGRVVRVFADEKTKATCHGVAFAYGRIEEASLLRYIRQREIELARADARR